MGSVLRVGEAERRTRAAAAAWDVVVTRSQRTVARHATDMGDLLALLSMLGVLPEGYPCDELKRPYAEVASMAVGVDPPPWWSGSLASVPARLAKRDPHDHPPHRHR